jgi:hypothetical protein
MMAFFKWIDPARACDHGMFVPLTLIYPAAHIAPWRDSRENILVIVLLQYLSVKH